MTPPIYRTPEPNRTPVTIDPRPPLPHEADAMSVRDITDRPGTFYRDGLHPAWLALAGLVGGLIGLVSVAVGAWWWL